jgi:hypothetical protein
VFDGELPLSGTNHVLERGLRCRQSMELRIW